MVYDHKVWLTDIKTLEDNHAFLAELGQVINRPDKAVHYNNKIAEIFSTLIMVKPVKTAYLIWEKPYMTVGGDTFIHDLMQKIGLQNLFSEQHRYPQITLEELAILNPQLILLSSEPYPFKEKNIHEIQALLPTAKVMLVDGEMFSWYGSRMKYMPAYFNKLLAAITV